MKLSSIFIASAALAAITLGSCSEHEIDKYSGVDAIFFDQQWAGNVNETWLDSTRLAHQIYTLVNFNNVTTGVDSILSIKIETIGYVRDYDRPFRVEVVADSTDATEGEEFVILNPELVIPAGCNSTRVNVKVSPSERLYSTTGRIQLRLDPGEHFVIPFGEDGFGLMPLRAQVNAEVLTELSTNFDPSIHNIFITGELSKPAKWPMYGNMYSWGNYSLAKYKLLLSIAEPYGWGTWHFEHEMPQERYGIISRAASAYLREQYNKGREHWVLDEDGSMMWVKGCPWADGTRPEEMVD